MKLDDIDNAILDVLRQDGRMSNREVGRTINVSEGTVRQRLKKLETSKAMRLGLVIDAAATGVAATAHIRIKARPDRVRAIADEVASMKACSFVGLSLGCFDIVALFVAHSRQEMADVVDNDLAKLPGIVTIDVRESIASLKHRYDLIYIT